MLRTDVVVGLGWEVVGLGLAGAFTLVPGSVLVPHAGKPHSSPKIWFVPLGKGG